MSSVRKQEEKQNGEDSADCWLMLVLLEVNPLLVCNKCSVAVFSPLLHLWVLCSPSHCCIHFWILKSRSQYTPKADTLTSAPLFCFYLVIFYLFLFWFEVFWGVFLFVFPPLFTSLASLPLEEMSTLRSFCIIPMNEWSQANRASHLFDILVWV